MRLFLRDSERRPDPVPVKTDDRLAIGIGLAAWVVATGVVLAFFSPISGVANEWALWTCAVGVLLGVAGLVYAAKRRR